MCTWRARTWRHCDNAAVNKPRDGGGEEGQAAAGVYGGTTTFTPPPTITILPSCTVCTHARLRARTHMRVCENRDDSRCKPSLCESVKLLVFDGSWRVFVRGVLMQDLVTLAVLRVQQQKSQLHFTDRLKLQDVKFCEATVASSQAPPPAETWQRPLFAWNSTDTKYWGS